MKINKCHIIRFVAGRDNRRLRERNEEDVTNLSEHLEELKQLNII